MQPLLPARAEAASSFRIGRKRVVATLAGTLGRWAVQQGILPRAEGGTQCPPATRLAGLLADPAAELPLSALTPAVLAALRERRRDALGSPDAVLVEQAALAAAVTELCTLRGLRWPHPLATPAADGMALLTPDALADARRDAGEEASALDLALATGARLDELEALARGACLSGWLALPGRRVVLPPDLAARLAARPGAGLAALLRRLGLTEPALRLTALAGRLAAGSHLDEVFLLAGCGAAPEQPGPLVPWFG